MCIRDRYDDNSNYNNYQGNGFYFPNYNKNQVSLPQDLFASYQQYMQPQVLQYCPSYIQTDTQDNKGMRLQPGIMKGLQTLSQAARKNSIPIQVFQNIKRADNFEKNNILISVQKYLFNLAEEGTLMVNQDNIINFLKQEIKIDDTDYEPILQQALLSGILHKQMRIIQSNQNIILYGLYLDNLSLQSLNWTIQSLKVDCLTPTEKIILSRIKECFQLKLTQKNWELIVQYIQLPKYQNHSNYPFSKLEYIKVNDFSAGSETFLIKLKDVEWEYHDQGKIDFESREWKLFQEFILNYFNQLFGENDAFGTIINEDIGSSNNLKSKKFPKLQQQIISNYCQVTNNELTIKVRAIPGGRYGCAQFVKFCGCKELQQCSICLLYTSPSPRDQA
eukprot:TRINITY_DN1246_c0_g1_i2.p1 TRINITY_DN1246_c0_g1~~TRINITY_DN1246_c0_g1_i2.p1  ORF type:complete len:390 (-),score=46.64 TRINITY_DN1246_c0_g1_i2:116-1285(-)